MRNSKRLPDKPSELILVAMEDFEKIEKNPHYEIYMKHWHFWDEEKCHVCFAGAVMANTLKLPQTVEARPADFGIEIDSKLRAIDWIGGGNFVMSLDCLGKYSSNIPTLYDCEYRMNYLSSFNRHEWKMHMATIIGILQAEGL